MIKYSTETLVAYDPQDGLSNARRILKKVSLVQVFCADTDSLISCQHEAQRCNFGAVVRRLVPPSTRCALTRMMKLRRGGRGVTVRALAALRRASVVRLVSRSFTCAGSTIKRQL